MAKEKYRLDALLRLKARLKKRAEMVLAKAIRALNEAKEKLKELEGELDDILEQKKEARREMKSKMDCGGMVGEGNVYVNFIRKLKDEQAEKENEIEDQETVIEDKQTALAVARHDYIEAAKELQVMEKHKELWEKKVKKEITSKEQKELDELGSTMHQLKNWRGEKSAIE